MKPIDQMAFHPTSEQLVQTLCNRTQNTNPMFFRIAVAYYYGVAAAMMRCRVQLSGKPPAPVNLYSVNLAPSGAGKTSAISMMEQEILGPFRNRFLDSTFPLMAETHLPKLANRRAIRKGTDPDEELQRTVREFEEQGELLFSFDSATTPAVKQARHKLLMAQSGALNYIMDEVGSNMASNSEVLNTCLELFDAGAIKPKLVKNTKENKRVAEIPGFTPTNLLMFGVPDALLDGARTEEDFYALLATGFARRCFFGLTKEHRRDTNLTAEELYARNTDVNVDAELTKLATLFEDLADPRHADKVLKMDKEVELQYLEYQLYCETLCEEMPEHDHMQRLEMGGRPFKVLKLAGAYAFADGVDKIHGSHVEHAIRLGEASGLAFERILKREKPYVKLARYIAGVGTEVTQADLVEALPYYKGTQQAKQDMLSLAIAHGYQNNILIKSSYIDNIQFLRGETLEETKLDKMILSYSDDIAHDYQNHEVSWDELEVLGKTPHMHWVNHHLMNGHRTEDNAIPRFNLLVLDVDDGITLQAAKELLKGYQAMFYTTKRHTEDHHRFRVVLPTNYVLQLDAKDYKEFMRNIADFLPFKIDTQTGQRARKWLTNDALCESIEGDLFDVLPFIPKTTKNEKQRKLLADQRELDNLERWVINNSGDGNRNNQLLRYAMILVDANYDSEAIKQKVMSLNDKMMDSLPEIEILSTIMVTVGKALGKREAAA